MTTDTLTRPDEDVDVDLDANVSCSVTGVKTGKCCEAPAVYVALLGCCEYQKLLCKEHLFQFSLRQGTECRQCRTVRPSVVRYWPI